MSVPKRHHYVPEMILNGFTDNNGWLHWCRPGVDNNVVRRSRPRELFHEKHLYSTLSEVGIKDPAMELKLSVLEGEAVGVVQAILEQARKGVVPILSSEQKRVWYQFFLMQWRRSPEAQRAVTSDAEAFAMIDDILNDVRRIAPHRKTEIDKLDTQEAKVRILRNVRVDALAKLSSDVMVVLERRGIAVLRITHPNKRFIVGSHPVVKLTMTDCTDLNNTSVELWMPIASDVAVGVGKGNGDVSLFLATDAVPVRQLNEAIAQQSGTIAAASQVLVRSIASPR
jgi:hypothetical protein